MLNFHADNFDRKIDLEGSNNQNEWFTILKNYRILSIKNELTNYQFSTLKFSESNFKYYRLLVPKEQNVELISATLMDKKTEKGKRIPFTFEQSTLEQKDKKTTQIDLHLRQLSPVSSITINIADTIDYYRKIEISCVSDSFKTEKGWFYNYKTLYNGTLNSLEKNQFNFESTILNKIKLIIFNNDNKPLTLKTITVEGYTHTLTARFTEPATYFLIYGNSTANFPSYDIAYFKENIPATVSLVSLGKLIKIKKDQPTQAALFEKKIWLWGLMGIIILILGWFSLKMLYSKNE